jgi:hypothetical protein
MGRLCIFFSRTSDGEIDPRSWHAGEPQISSIGSLHNTATTTLTATTTTTTTTTATTRVSCALQRKMDEPSTSHNNKKTSNKDVLHVQTEKCIMTLFKEVDYDGKTRPTSFGHSDDKGGSGDDGDDDHDITSSCTLQAYLALQLTVQRQALIDLAHSHEIYFQNTKWLANQRF